jgi:plastocyanin
MMRNTIYALLTLFLLVSCSSKKAEQTEATEDYGHPENNEVPTTIPETKVEEVPLKNTATFHTVVIRQMKFEPTVLKLHKGDTVLWINKDITEHDITEEVEKKWSSSKIPVNKSWSMVVKQRADYFCSIHVVMKGKLLVE